MSDGNIILAVKTWETKLATMSVKKYLTTDISQWKLNMFFSSANINNIDSRAPL